MADCQFCDIMNGEERAKEIYADDKVVAVLKAKPASPGHLLVFTKKHWPIIEQVPDFVIGHVFKVVNKLSRAVFESLNVQGTNIIVENGVAAGQKIPHFCVNIIPRTEGDGLNFQWITKKLSKEEMDDAQFKIKEGAANIHPSGFEKEKAGIIDLGKKKKIEKISEEENYLIKQLRRIP